MCGCEFILELSDAMQKLGIKALDVCIRHHWRSRRSENSSRIFCAFLPCVCDFEMTVNSVRVTTHILCVLLFFWDLQSSAVPDTSIALFELKKFVFFLFHFPLIRPRLLLLLVLLLDVVFNSNFMTRVECKIREFRRSEREMHTQKIHFHFISLPRSTAMRLFEIFFCYFVYVYRTHFSCRLMLPFIVITLNFILTFEWKDSNWTFFEWIASQFHKSHCW